MSHSKVSIRIAGNTMIPTLQALSAKGYKISLWSISGDDGGLTPQFDAEKESRTFSATSAEGLLGLITMWEVRGDDWQQKEGEYELWSNLIESVPTFEEECKDTDS
jgi:hypothetical protein